MATDIQRMQTIGNALLNRTATTAELNRLGAALAHHAAASAEYTHADAAGKAEIAIRELRQLILATIKAHETQAAIAGAANNAAAVVDSDFAEEG